MPPTNEQVKSQKEKVKREKEKDLVIYYLLFTL
jgi:hypothetical protein